MVIKKEKDDKKAENLTVTTEEKPKEFDPANEDLVNRQFLFPKLAEGVQKLNRKYPDDPHKAVESEWTNFKAKTDFSIPVKRTVLQIIRIRTMSNPEQALGEYVYYTAKLTGFQKQYIGGKIETFPSCEMADAPFGMDVTKVLQPSFKNGELAGYEDKGQFRFYDKKFTPDAIDTILENSSPEEGIATKYTVIDTSSVYGGFTKEELQTCKLNRLIYRNSNKLNGTTIAEEDKIK
jgi:hypothetical protein